MATEKKDLIMIIERVMTMPIRTSYRFARDHFLVFSLVVFMLILYRSCPLLFAFLVNTSPILICTTLLLGLLLSYGEPNTTPIDIKDAKKKQEVFPLSSWATANDFHTKKYANFAMGNRAVNGPDIKEFATQEPLLREHSKVVYQKEDSLYVQGAQYKDSERITGNISGINEEEAFPHDEQKPTQGGPQSEQLIKNREIHLQKRDKALEELGADGAFAAVDKDESGSLMFEIRDGYLGLPWQRVNDQDLSDSDSDKAESSSSDASMTKINQIFNELDHDLLLNEETSRPVPRIKDDDYAASQRSSLVDDSDDNSDDGVESLVGVEDEVQKQKADGSEAAVKWTADDQKNVMDLGYSEVERNMRLRILIAKRQEKKNMSLDQSNLINFGDDWELSRFRFEIPPISAPRRNPFDVSSGSEETQDLPPIPGSAPSFVPRRNPFDILYDQQDENGNLISETQSSQEHMPVPPRETILRRNETFTLGRRQSGTEKHHSWLKPYFTAEIDRDSSHIYHRQFSDRSDSKVSTVPESDSVSSLADPEYEKENYVDAEEEDIFVDVEEEDQNETKYHEESSYVAGPYAKSSLKPIGQIGKAEANSYSRSLKEDSTASVTISGDFIHHRDFIGSQSIDRTESLDSTGYESLSELQSDLTCMSSRNLLGGHLNVNDLIHLDSSEEESDVVQPINEKAAEVDDQILSELDVVGDFHPHPYLQNEPRMQTLDVRSVSYDNTSGSSVSEVNFHKPSQEDSISIHQEITESGVAFTFGSFGDLERTVHNPKWSILQIGTLQENDLKPLKNVMECSVSDYNIEKQIMVKSDPELIETGTTSRYMEGEVPASEPIVIEANDIQSAFKQIKEEGQTGDVIPWGTYSELHVLDERSFDDMHFPSKKVSDTTDDKASKVTEAVEVRTVERRLNPDVPDEKYIKDDSLQSNESVPAETNLEGDKKAKSGSKAEHHISNTKKIYKVVGSTGPRVDPGSHHNGVVVQPKTGDHTARAEKAVGAPKFQAPAVTRPNSRGSQKVYQQWRRVTLAVRQKQDVEPNAAPSEVAGKETVSNAASQQKKVVPSVNIPREEAIPIMMISPQHEIPSVDSPRHHKIISDQMLQQLEIPSVNIPNKQQEDATEKSPELLDQMLVQSRVSQEEEETNENPTNDSRQSDILEAPSVVMENGLLETEKYCEKSDPQQQEEKKKKKKKKKSKNSRNYCFNCGEPDHQRDSCPLGASVCYHCLQSGHGFKECPKKLQDDVNNEIQKDTPQEASTQEGGCSGV